MTEPIKQTSSTDIKDIDFKNNAISLYKDLLSVPSIANAVITNKDSLDGGDVNISIVVSQSDLVNKKEKSYMFNRIVGADGHVHSSPFPIELTSSIVSISPSGRRMVTIKEIGETEYTFDIVDQHNRTGFISSKEVHKKVCNDEWFGGISWSPCERYIAYIAEKKVDTATFYEKEPKDKLVGDQFLYRNDWGETYPTIYNPSIYVVDTLNETVIPIPWSMDLALTAGQVIWTPNGDGLVFVGWKINLRRFGIRACFNRQSSIYYIDFQSLLKKRETLPADQIKTINLQPINLLGGDRKGCFRSPRFTVDGKKIVFFGIPGIVLPHNTCSLLYSLVWNVDQVQQDKPQKVEILIDEKNHKDTFKGIYCQSLPSNPWIDQNTLIFHTPNKACQVIYSFNIITKELNTIQGLLGGSCTVFDVSLKTKQFIFSESTINRPASLFIGKLKDNDKSITQSNLEFKQFFENKITNEKVVKLLTSIDFSIQEVKIPGEKYGSDIDSFEIIQVMPKNPKSGKSPVLLYPHGGPHVESANEYLSTVIFLVGLGYAITLINYRGSTGYGKDFVDLLPGRIGTVDVDDCLAALDHVVAKYPNQLDIDQAGVIGGSHGGFLSGHLIGQTQRKMKACFMRNPVIDIPSMATLSDIPDWCFFEAGIPLPAGKEVYPTVPTLAEIEIMRKVSPIAKLEHMTTPTLLVLGEGDLRVPPSQGLLLYNSLLQKGTPTKCLSYPKTGHGLTSIDAKIDHWIHIACWMHQYLFIENQPLI
ncbi:acylaminoacyl-peptidase [Cavenderia fasciculata]|uniref:acylaminoacyl-peptidase n=1 Tax=Cavenderia fasciculata TaxID=261658 RepID=F4Q6T1_CACFS|nr:acylaminoacyl-peptidase [Cavenderia fasciculata]EGG16591.1 acylaminoacyl-peptidase [Cavenderia fasciculata]|eukprot:XP_004354991.1 acylaminoacyl-peptidase [Cavenderia fasciculata]